MGETSLLEKVKLALEGGVTMIQLREKQLSFDEFLEEAFVVKQLCDIYKVPLIINDNVEICKKVDAAGVHLGQSDRTVFEARELLGENKIIGATAKSIQVAVECEKDGADYLGVGAVFGSETKRDAKCISIPLLNSIAETVKIPVVAIGGINLNNIDLLRKSKISGAAIIKGIFAQDDILLTCRNLKEKLMTIV